LGSGKTVPSDILRRPVDVVVQRALSDLAMRTIGFDLGAGRFDLADHPFTSQIGPGDSRITTRFSERDWADGLLCLLHELGHGLYDQGLDARNYGTPCGEPASLGMHESQARLFENHVGRSRAFWRFFLPHLARLSPHTFDDASVDTLFAALNRVAPSLTRVRADQVTYDIHIFIRFQIERALLGGRLEVRDLRDAWNDAYRQHLAIAPQNDAEGCLQDGHWSAGMFGYFPTYTLGNLIAAQLQRAAERDLGSFEEAWARGDFTELLTWLRRKIHRRGREVTAAELISEATGEPLGVEALVDSLGARARELYGV
jgi:carboxypeptidase Taq